VDFSRSPATSGSSRRFGHRKFDDGLRLETTFSRERINRTNAMDETPDSIARSILQSCDIHPKVGIVLGSGLGPLGDHLQNAIGIPYQEIPGFPVSRVAGHAGKLILGTLQSVPVVAMQGRAHLYEGWSLSQASLPIETMIAMGIELLIVSNASGGINLRFRSGEIVLIDSHINLLFRSPGPERAAEHATFAQSSPLRSSDVYSRDWIQKVQKCALRLGFSLPLGTYLATLGPNYETRAEYRAFAKMGADMVGMSTVPEVLCAARRRVPVLGFSIITNIANPDRPTQTDHSEVLDWSTSAQQRLLPLLGSLLSEFSPHR
jgi:purine-nucleoside phosphorylase